MEMDSGPWRFLLICMVVGHGMGRDSLEMTGAVVQWCSRGPIFEGVWARAEGTEV